MPTDIQLIFPKLIFDISHFFLIFLIISKNKLDKRDPNFIKVAYLPKSKAIHPIIHRQCYFLTSQNNAYMIYPSETKCKKKTTHCATFCTITVVKNTFSFHIFRFILFTLEKR